MSRQVCPFQGVGVARIWCGLEALSVEQNGRAGVDSADGTDVDDCCGVDGAQLGKDI
jgi:hypothetical protein